MGVGSVYVFASGVPHEGYGQRADLLNRYPMCIAWSSVETLILCNVLLRANNSYLSLKATDLDL